MHCTTLYDHVTRTAYRLQQLDRPVRIARVIGLGRGDEHHGARQEYIVVSRAGPVLFSHICSQQAEPKQKTALPEPPPHQPTMGALAPGGTSLNLMLAPWGKRSPSPGIGFTLMSEPALEVGTRSWLKTGRPNHCPPSSDTRGSSSVTTSTAGSEFQVCRDPPGQRGWRSRCGAVRVWSSWLSSGIVDPAFGPGAEASLSFVGVLTRDSESHTLLR